MGVTASQLSPSGRQFLRSLKQGDADQVSAFVETRPALLHHSTFGHQETAVHIAAALGFEEVLATLLQHVDDVAHCNKLSAVLDAKNDRWVTPLMLAAAGRHVGCARLLLEQGADPWISDRLGGRKAIHYAVRANCPEIIQLLLDAAGAERHVDFPRPGVTKYVDVCNIYGFTPLHYAAMTGATQAAEVLITNGAKLCPRSMYDSLEVVIYPPFTTPLHVAATEGSIGVAKVVLQAYMERCTGNHMPDPRRLRNILGQQPCDLVKSNQPSHVKVMLLPTTALVHVFTLDELCVFGPPSLQLLAAVALRQKLMARLAAVQCARQLDVAANSSTCTTQANATGRHMPGQCFHCASGTHGSKYANQQHSANPYAGPAAASECSAMMAVHGANTSAEGACYCHAGDDADHEDDTCGICLDDKADVVMKPCGHAICAGCCKQLFGLDYAAVVLCAFCRTPIGDLAAA
eukprot:jgi/Chrzof1/10520/Cz05g01240.t1